MSTKELLDLMRLLSAIESWGLGVGKPIPDYLHDQLCASLALIEAKILGNKE